MRAQRYTGQQYTSAGASSAWIGPDGQWFHVKDCGHYEAARAMGESCGTLERAGWVHLSWSSAYLAVGRPTAAQLVRLEECAARWLEEGARRHAQGRDVFDVEACEEYAQRLTDYVRESRMVNAPRRGAADGFYDALSAALAPAYRRDGD